MVYPLGELIGSGGAFLGLAVGFFWFFFLVFLTLIYQIAYGIYIHVPKRIEKSSK